MRRPQFYYGWAIVGGAFASDFLWYGVGTVAFGIFFRFMSEGLGWSRGLLSSAILLSRLVTSAVSPVVGPLVDRYGPRYVMLVGAVAMAAGAAALGLVHAPWHFFLAYGGLVALGGVCLGEISGHTTVARWFVRQRGRAFAVVTMGLSSAGIVLPLPLAYVIEAYGWRTAWGALGAVVLVVGVAAALVMRRRPEDYGLLPDGRPPPSAHPAPTAPAPATRDPEPSFTPREAVRTPAFWLLVASANLGGLALTGINIHLVTYLMDRGFALVTATGIVTFLYTLQTAAKPFWGFVSERLHVRFCIALCYLGGGLGALLLLAATTLPGVALFALVYGLTRGAQSLLVSLAWANYFGRAAQGAIRGIVAPSRLLSTAGGPLVAGALYDVTQAYTLPFIVFAACFWLGSLAVVLARPPRPAAVAAPVGGDG